MNRPRPANAQSAESKFSWDGTENNVYSKWYVSAAYLWFQLGEPEDVSHIYESIEYVLIYCRYFLI